MLAEFLLAKLEISDKRLCSHTFWVDETKRFEMSADCTKTLKVQWSVQMSIEDLPHPP